MKSKGFEQKLESLVFNAYYVSVLARGIASAQHKTKFVSNQFESAKNLAETSMLFVSNWENLVSGFRLLVGNNNALFDKKIFYPSSWMPTLKNSLLNFVQNQSMASAASQIFLNMATIYSIVTLFKSLSMFKALLFCLGFMLRYQSFNKEAILSLISNLVSTMTSYYESFINYFSAFGIGKSDETLVEKINNVIDLKDSIVTKLNDTTKYSLPQHYLELKHNIFPTITLLLSKVTEQAFFVLLPLAALGISNEEYVHWLAKL